MLLAEARKLKVGDRVEIWGEHPEAAAGTVTEINDELCRILWDDTGKHSVIHLRDMADVNRHRPARPIIDVRTGKPVTRETVEARVH